jgi:hypothetical protein
MTRQYLNGNPTDGWKRGTKVLTLDAIRATNLLLLVSHQDREENLILVKEVKPNGFFYVFVTPAVEEMPGRPIFHWDFDINTPQFELFRALKVG